MRIIDRKFLPTTTPSVHAATMVFWKDHPVFAWFGGSREGQEDVAIYIYNLQNNGETIILGNQDAVPRWNPILITNNDKIYLFEKVGRFCDCWQTFFHDITDWDVDFLQKQMRKEAQWIPAGLNGPVKTAPIIKDNIMYCGSSVETFIDWTSYIECYTIDNKYIDFVGRSNPLSVPNKKLYVNSYGMTKNTLGIIQPSLWDDGSTMHALFRASSGLESLYYSCAEINSYSGIAEWKEPVPTNIPNPNSGVDTVYYENQLYLVYNPSSTLRHPLTISKVALYSVDEDKATFSVSDSINVMDKVNEDEMTLSSELSYPYMIESNGLLHLVYTYGRSKIEYCVVEL